jgi:glycerophosphoryl diester phosphodiesterase
VENIKSVDDNLADLGFVPAVYSPSHVLVDPELVRRCHQHDMQVIPWTVNETDAMQRLIGMGVDGIITDYPNRIPQP